MANVKTRLANSRAFKMLIIFGIILDAQAIRSTVLHPKNNNTQVSMGASTATVASSTIFTA